MRRLPFLILVLLLPLPSTLLAAPAVRSVPEWSVGDTWQYKVTTQSGAATTLGNLTLKVVADGDVRIGNTTVRAYTLSQRLQPWTPAGKTGLSQETRWGPVYTIVTTTLIIERKTLCTLVSNSTIRSVHGADVTEDRELLEYSPSDGRLRFPLTPGESWTATFNVSRTRHYPFQVVTQNSTLTRRYDCQAYENVTFREKGYRVRCTTDGSPSETVFWYSPHYRADVRREEYDPSSGTVQTFSMVSFKTGQAQSLLSSPQTVLALFFGVAAAAMLAVAILVRFLPGPLGRFRARYREKHPPPEPGEKEKAAPTRPAGHPVPPRGRSQPQAAPPARTGPGRSI